MHYMRRGVVTIIYIYIYKKKSGDYYKKKKKFCDRVHVNNKKQCTRRY